LGNVFEQPISDLFLKGYSAVVEQAHTQGPLLLFSWLSLLF
jgi:hypothetical protein